MRLTTEEIKKGIEFLKEFGAPLTQEEAADWLAEGKENDEWFAEQEDIFRRQTWRNTGRC